MDLMHLGTPTVRGHRYILILAATLLVCSGTPDAAAMQGVPQPAPADTTQSGAPMSSPGGLGNAPRKPDVLSPDQRSGHSLITDREQLLSYFILAFGTAVLIVQYLLLRSPKRDAYEILQLLAINLIVTGTLFLISAGFDAQQIAPGLGLFGTIAGYVLGRKSGEAAKGTRAPDNDRGAP